MRQAGMMAAGALYALHHHRERLAEDHLNAQLLASGLQKIPGVTVDPVETNIVVIHIPSISSATLVKKLKTKDVAVLTRGDHSIRAVTNLMVNQDQIQQVPKLLEHAINEGE